MPTFNGGHKDAIADHGTDPQKGQPKQGALQDAAGSEQPAKASLGMGSALGPQLAAGIRCWGQILAGCGIDLQVPAQQGVHGEHAACSQITHQPGCLGSGNGS